MKKIINQIKNNGTKNVIVIGDIMLDEYIFGSVDRISPEAPVPVLKQGKTEWSLGGAANVAANCRHIGFKVHLLGLIGAHDKTGEKVSSLLNELKISLSGLVRSSERVTTTKQRIMAQSHQMLRVDSENNEPLSTCEFRELTQRFDECIKPNTIILISDYSKGVISSNLINYILQKTQGQNCTILVDPKGPDFKKYKGVHFLKPNFKEYQQIAASLGLPKQNSIEENGMEICKQLNLQGGLLVTLGEKGIKAILPTGCFDSPSVKREVYDLTGAGDTVFAYLALGLSHGLTLESTLNLANHAAAVAVSHLKTYAVSLDELVDKQYETSEKIFLDWARLKIELDWLKLENKKVVFTNGCFDILHPGHIHVLREAKKLGDILVVAINTDASIKRYKGDARPVNSLDDRMAVMAAIGVVDFVVSFDQDTPKELVAYLKPDVLVKGGDYQAINVAGYDTVIENGGRVEIIDLVPGKSTTNIVKKITPIKNQAVC